MDICSSSTARRHSISVLHLQELPEHFSWAWLAGCVLTVARRGSADSQGDGLGGWLTALRQMVLVAPVAACAASHAALCAGGAGALGAPGHHCLRGLTTPLVRVSPADALRHHLPRPGAASPQVPSSSALATRSHSPEPGGRDMVLALRIGDWRSPSQLILMIGVTDPSLLPLVVLLYSIVFCIHPIGIPRLDLRKFCRHFNSKISKIFFPTFFC